MRMVEAGSSPARGGRGQQALVAQAEALASTERAVQQRRLDAEQHQYREIWTKDSHGGPYHKAVTTTGYDALEMPNGKEIKPDIGYEKPQGGPTTNFVGNHMTQGAIDLVQAQLEGLGTGYSGPGSVEGPAACPPPMLISRTPAATPSSPTWSKVETFSWSDEPNKVRVIIPTEGKDSGDVQATLTATETSLRLEVVETKTEKRRVFQVSPLFACVIANECHHTTTVKSGSAVVELVLPKARSGEKWVTLRSEETMRPPKMITHPDGVAPAAGSIEAQHQPPSLESLRKMVRANRNTGNSGGQLPSFQDEPDGVASYGSKTHKSLSSAALPPEQMPQTAADANAKARLAANAGDYGLAAEIYHWGTLHPETTGSGLTEAACESWMGLGRCYEQLGNLSAAAEAFGTAYGISATVMGPAEQTAALFHQGRMLEQQEKPEQARSAFREALVLSPGHSGASDGLRRMAYMLRQVSDSEAQQAQLRAQPRALPAAESCLMPSVPRPGMAAFKNRGKAGKPF